jgi:rhamnosyltransferase
VIIRNQHPHPSCVDLENIRSRPENVRTMPTRSLCAVMVSYHPLPETIENIKGVLAQVKDLVVVDNGSNANELALLRASRRVLGFHIIENSENLGIAEALNQGIAWARSQGYSWVILFDQDSAITDGFVDRMFATWESHPERERVGSVHPRYKDGRTGLESRPRGDRYEGGPLTSMTSGSLIPMWIFDRVGYFASEFFIDCVDHEYCFRLFKAGYFVVDSKEAVLLHSLGHVGLVKMLGFRFSPTNHSALRRYYMSRNRVVVCRKYIRVFPVWVLQYMYVSFRETAKCFLGERDRKRKLRNFLLGTWDGLVGRMGKREDL